MKKLGAINLVHQYRRESNIKNREALMSSISAFIRGENFDSKREFLQDFEGMSFLKGVLLDE